jgi:hypothetical protein
MQRYLFSSTDRETIPDPRPQVEGDADDAVNTANTIPNRELGLLCDLETIARGRTAGWLPRCTIRTMMHAPVIGHRNA